MKVQWRWDEGWGRLCHYVPIRAGAIHQHRNVLPEGLLAPSLVSMVSTVARMCFSFVSPSPDVFLGVGAVSKKVRTHSKVSCLNLVSLRRAKVLC